MLPRRLLKHRIINLRTSYPGAVDCLNALLFGLRSGLLHCLTPTNSSDRVTNVFAYTNDFRNSPALFGYLESFFPGLWMDHANTQAENLNSSNESRSVMANDGLFRLGSTVAIPLAGKLRAPTIP